MMPFATFLRRMLSRTTGLVKSRFGFADFDVDDGGDTASLELANALRVMRANARADSRRAVDGNMNKYSPPQSEATGTSAMKNTLKIKIKSFHAPIVI